MRNGTDDSKSPIRAATGLGSAGDALLVRRMQAGDEAAFETLVRGHSARMLSTARRLLEGEQDAQDAVQDAFISAFKNIDSFEGKSQLGSWLHRIVVNAALMKLRRRQRRRERSIDELLPTYENSGRFAGVSRAWSITHEVAVENQETRQLVRDSIDELPDAYRSVLLLRDIEQLSTHQTAEILDITPGAVNTRLHRARQALKTLLDNHMMDLNA